MNSASSMNSALLPASISRRPTAEKSRDCSRAVTHRVTCLSLLNPAATFCWLDERERIWNVENLRALEDALTSFAGCAVVISHDRFFLTDFARISWPFEGDAHVEWFQGNFED